MSIGFGVVKNALDASLLCQDGGLVVLARSGWSEVRLPFCERDLYGLGCAFQFGAEDGGFACLSSCDCGF